MLIAAILVAALLAGLASLFAALTWLGGFGTAHPTERSNHSRPTPQIGGIALVPLWVLAMAGAALSGAPVPVFSHPAFLAAVLLLFVTGIVDDRRHLGAAAKLLAQFAAAAIATIALGDVLRALPLPSLVTVPLAILALVAFVNLTNFIDGLDLMAVATVGIPSLAFTALCAAGLVAFDFAPAGAVLAGLLAAFIAVNRPPARSFLGDGGSLPFGLILGTMVVVTASETNVLVAAMLAAYIVLDGVSTIVRRTVAGENIVRAHSTHVYQRAFRNGRSVVQITACAALLGGLAGALATAAAWWGTMAAALAGTVVVIVAWLALSRWMLGGRTPS